MLFDIEYSVFTVVCLFLSAPEMHVFERLVVCGLETIIHMPMFIAITHMHLPAS